MFWQVLADKFLIFSESLKCLLWSSSNFTKTLRRGTMTGDKQDGVGGGVWRGNASTARRADKVPRKSTVEARPSVRVQRGRESGCRRPGRGGSTGERGELSPTSPSLCFSSSLASRTDRGAQVTSDTAGMSWGSWGREAGRQGSVSAGRISKLSQ